MTVNAVRRSTDKPERSKPQTTEETALRIASELGESWLPILYRERIRSLRTRSHKVFPATKGASVEVQHTLLGIELKVGRKRQQCPDLSTARYLAVFARVGCSEVAVPYDITRISQLADELESSWQRMLLLAAHLTAERSRPFQMRVRTLLVNRIRREIEETGAGAAVPEFNQNTKQRRRTVQGA